MLFYNGRLYNTPAVMSAINDSAMANMNLSTGNVVAYIGLSTGGEPNTILEFGSPDDAKAALVGGELMTACVKAFNPSNELNGPSKVVAIRVNPAVQAALTLQDSTPANVITLASTDYGLYTNQIKTKIETGTTSGKLLTTQLGTAYYSQDNVARNSFTIQYTGALATAVMSVTNSTVTLEAPAATVVATIDLATYPTVQQLVDYINSVADFSAAVADGNGATATVNALDTVTSQDVKTALYTATADLQAIVDWYNGISEGYITATRVAGAGTVPANIAFTYLAGGSDGVTTNTEWSNGYTTLQTADVQWVVPISADSSIAAMNSAHCQYMSTVAFQERRGFVGGAIGDAISVAIADALALNDDRTAQCYPGYYDYDDNGNLTLYASYMTAAVVAAAFAGSSPGTPLTNKSLTFKGVETILRNPTDTDDLIAGGVLCIEKTSTGYKVVKSISTWLTNSNYNRVEVSTGFAADYVARSVRTGVEVLKGTKGGPISVGEAVSKADSVLRELAVPEPQGPGVIVGDATNPAYKNITGTMTGDVIAITFQCSPVIPVNYETVTIYVVPYSGTASA